MNKPVQASADHRRLTPALTSPRLARWVAPGAAALLFVLGAVALRHLLREVKPGELSAGLQALPASGLWLAVLCTAASYLSLVGYDLSALAYIGRRLAFRTVLTASFCGYALGNNLGFNMLTGGTVRLRIYSSAGLDLAETTRVAMFASISFIVGAHTLAGVGMIQHPEALAPVLHLSPGVISLVGFATLVLVGALLLATALVRRPLTLGRVVLRLPGLGLSVLQLGVCVVEMALAAAALYILLPGDPGLPYGAFLLVYAVAVVAGLVSHVPGGVGVFETVVLVALQGRGEAQQVAAALLAYRVIYYLIPLALAGGVLLVREVRQAPVEHLARLTASISEQMAPVLGMGLAIVAGMTLLWSAMLPAIPARVDWINEWLPLAAIESSHLASTLVGAMLLTVAGGLYRRSRGAWMLALGLCLTGAVFSILKGYAWEEALLLSAAALGLLLGGPAFYRSSALLDGVLSAVWFASLTAAVGGMGAVLWFAYGPEAYRFTHWLGFELHGDVARAQRALLGVLGTMSVSSLVLLLRPPARRTPGPPPELAVLRRIIAAGDQPQAHLALSGDKQFLLDSGGEAFLMYDRHGASWVAMGDPVGAPAQQEELAWRFRQLVDRAGGRMAFYNTGSELLALYLDLGLWPLKIGEEALVPLVDGASEPSGRAVLEQALRDGEREGLSFEVLPSITSAVLLEALSLPEGRAGRGLAARGAGFATGGLVPGYLQTLPLAVLRRGGELAALAALWGTTTRTRQAADLLWLSPDTGDSTLFFWYGQLLAHARAQGFGAFSLGMAPLVELDAHPLAPYWERFGEVLYNRSGIQRDFRKLRAFMGHFEPQWQPRYLVTPRGLAPLQVLADVAALISPPRGSAPRL